MKNNQANKKMEAKEAQRSLNRVNATHPSEVLKKNLSFCQKVSVSRQLDHLFVGRKISTIL
jgi:hypothetical protein